MSAIAQSQSPTDWTQWRGPSRDGIIGSFTPPQTWPDALIRRWNVEIGTGYATPIVVADRVYQFSRIGENETMTSFDAATGKTLWQMIEERADVSPEARMALDEAGRIIQDRRVYDVTSMLVQLGALKTKVD